MALEPDMRSRLRPANWFLLGIATLAVFSHVCGFSFHAHAAELHVHLGDVSGPVPSTHDHEEAGGSGPDADHALHGASCEVVRPVPPAALPVLQTAAFMHLETSTPALHGALGVGLSVISSAPPLFLLHAALLI